MSVNKFLLVFVFDCLPSKAKDVARIKYVPASIGAVMIEAKNVCG